MLSAGGGIRALFLAYWEKRERGPRNSLPPSEGAGRGVPRGPHSFLRIAATLRIAGRATRGMPRAPDPGAKTNLRGVAAHAARWGGTGRAPSNPPALGLGFDAWDHSRETRELAGAVGEGATPCTDGRPSENTPPWLGLHQSSLPNAAKGYPPREPRENTCRGSWSTWSAVINLTSRTGELRSAPSWPDARHRVAGKRALAQGVRGRRAITRVSEGWFCALGFP